MSKTNKELAVDVAIAYIQASSELHRDSPVHIRSLPALENINTIIRSVHQTLSKLDELNED